MVCPICVTSAIIANAPAIVAGVAGTASAVQGKKMYKRVQNKGKKIVLAQTPSKELHKRKAQKRKCCAAEQAASTTCP
jgi:hypothetical protein